ncbi:MAG: AAA family ATPase, partial [Anaerolineaceae bacterium]
LASLPTEPEGPLAKLAEIGGLSAFDIGCLLLCLSSEQDLGTERLVAYTQDDVSKRRPRIDLALRVLESSRRRGELRAAFHLDAPLRRWRLIALHDEQGQPHTPLLARYISLDPRIAAYLLGETGIDEALQGLVERTAAPHSTALPSALATQVAGLATLPVTALRPPVLAISGPDRTRILAVAHEVSIPAGLGVLRASAPLLLAELGLEPGFLRASREAALQNSSLVLDGIDDLKLDDADRLRLLAAGTCTPLLVLASKEPFGWPGVTITVPALEHEARRNLWQEHLADDGIDDATLDAVAGKFKLGITEIEKAVEAARGSARWRSAGDPAVNEADLYAAARAQSTPILNNLARKITPHYAWDDIVLAPDPLQQLREIAGMVEHRHTVYELWGFERKLAMGKGILSLFAGPSGTGKTMAADIIAGVLGLDMYKIDLSGIVSKYIGETEKNLSTIFAEAESSNSILFFDEADALFGKRSEVKDAHDRYANIETAYLLQRMEEYSGPVILSTNLKMNLDEAFLRRLHFVIDFPMPEEAERRRIWSGTVPVQAPRGEELDFDFLARQFKISGGNIRNIVLSAAFLAAADDGELCMRHLIRATRREYQKLGKMVTEAEFGPYIGVLSP